ncbi:hypothetical protein [Nocardia nova]|uniref:hypothetical protein n=1 Tax=Nocardia nova TaxID=37330 RepID=UPI0025AFF70E|nr:hypothetical protein [Nocardia nova]
MTDVWICCAVALGVLLVGFVGVMCWPSRIPKGCSVEEILERIQDEQDEEV